MQFDTKTEEAFYNYLKLKGVLCKKIKVIQRDKSYPDFLCKYKDCEAVFELKNFDISGSTEYRDPNIIAQSITFSGTIQRDLRKSKGKFLNEQYKNFPSAMVFINLRPRTGWEIIVQQTEDAVSNNFYKHPEIGNIILAGYNESSNSIMGFYIYENQYSNRVISRGFFENLNPKFCNL